MDIFLKKLSSFKVWIEGKSGIHPIDIREFFSQQCQRLTLHQAFLPILRQQAQQIFRNLEFRKFLEFRRNVLRFYSENCIFYLKFSNFFPIFEFRCDVCLSFAKTS